MIVLEIHLAFVDIFTVYWNLGFFLDLLILFYADDHFAYIYVSICTTYMTGACLDQKRKSDPLKLEFIVIHHVGFIY